MTSQYGPAGQYPNGPNYSATRNRKKHPKWLWAVVGAVALVGVVAGIRWDPKDDSPAASATSTSTSTSTTTTTTRAERSLSPEQVERMQQRQRERAAAAAASSEAAAASREAAAAAAAAAKAALLDPSSYEALGERDFALIARDPDGNKGRKIVIYGVVTQADSVTGNSMFRADTSAVQGWNWYDFDENSVISVKDPNIIANVVKDDLVALYVEVKGSMSYNTTLGGKMTVPEFTAHIVNVYGSK